MARSWSSSAVAAITVFPSIGSLLFGYDIGATSYVLNQLQSEENAGVAWWHRFSSSPLLQALVPAAAVAGALVGSIIVFTTPAGRIGQRRELQLAAVLYAVGSLLMVSAPSGGLAVPFVFGLGRFVFGLGGGFALHGAPSYIAEMSPAELRGSLVALFEVMLVLGMVLGYTIGYFQQDVVGGWRYTYGAAAPLSALMLAGMTSLPPSARWLAFNGQHDAARASLSYVFGQDGEGIMHEILDQIKPVPVQYEDGGRLGMRVKATQRASLFDRRYRDCLVAGVGVVVLQQVTGQPSVLYYTSTIFADEGMSDAAPVGTSIFKLVATLVALSLVERKGRRFLLLVGVSIMLGALVLMAIAYGLPAAPGDEMRSDRTLVIIVGMLAYLGGYQIGFGPVSWLLISELFPLEVRGGAMAFAVANNFACNLVVSFAYPIVVDWFATIFGDAYKHAAGFTIFALLTLYALVFVYRYVPETKGLSLEEIERKLCSDGSLLGTGSISTSSSSAAVNPKAGNGFARPLDSLPDQLESAAGISEVELTQRAQRNVIIFNHPLPSLPQPLKDGDDTPLAHIYHASDGFTGTYDQVKAHAEAHGLHWDKDGGHDPPPHELHLMRTHDAENEHENGADSVTSALHDETSSASASFEPDERIARFYGSPIPDPTSESE